MVPILPTEAETDFSPKTNSKERLDPLFDQMMDILNKVGERDRDTERQESTVINLINNDFIKKLRDQVKASIAETKRRGYLVSDEDRDRVIRGLFFEMLVINDEEINPKPSPIATELLNLIQDPAEYLGESFSDLRNPDIAFIDTDEKGRIVIKGVGEVKLGLLNDRALDQIHRFRRNIKRILNGIKTKIRESQQENPGNILREIKLNEVAKFMEINKVGNGEIYLNDIFEITVAVPSNRQIDNDSDIKSLVRDRRFSVDQYLKGAKEAGVVIKVKKAAFSVREVVDLSRLVAEKMDEQEIG